MNAEGVRAEARVTTRPTEEEIETWHAFYEFWRRMHQFWHDEALEFSKLAQGEFVGADTIAPPVSPAETAILELIRLNKLSPSAPASPMTPSTSTSTPERYFFCTACGRNRPWRLQRDPWRGAKCSECYSKDVRR